MCATFGKQKPLVAMVTWLSCSLSRSSVTPRDLIPLTRQAAWTSFTFRLCTPSSAISWKKHSLRSQECQYVKTECCQWSCVKNKSATFWPQWCTLSSARMALSFMISWKRRKLLVPMDWSSSRRHRATSWGRVKLSNVSSSSNSLENFIICSLLGRSPESRIYMGRKVVTCKSFCWKIWKLKGNIF